MKNLTKSMLGAGAAAAALVGMAVPAQARDYGRDRDNISVGEVIAGAVILGGIAAVLSSGKNRQYNDRGYEGDYRNDGEYRNDDRRGRRNHHDDRGDDYRNGGNGYNNGNYGSRAAVSQCINGVENYANRYSRSEVTEIRDIQRTYNGYRVSGNVVVKDGYRGRSRYDRGYDRGYDQGRFTCYVEQGRVIDIDYRGLDQWR